MLLSSPMFQEGFHTFIMVQVLLQLKVSPAYSTSKSTHTGPYYGNLKKGTKLWDYVFYIISVIYSVASLQLLPDSIPQWNPVSKIIGLSLEGLVTNFGFFTSIQILTIFSCTKRLWPDMEDPVAHETQHCISALSGQYFIPNISL